MLVSTVFDRGRGSVGYPKLGGCAAVKHLLLSRTAEWLSASLLAVTSEQSQLEAMKLKQFHTATMPPAPIHIKTREEKEVRPHTHARRVSSDESSWTKGGPEGRICTIPELAESFERRLRLRNQKIMSLSDADSVCLICHELCTGGGGGGVGGAHELHCSHRFHKEKGRRSEPGGRPRSGSSTGVCERRKEVPFCAGQEEYRMPRRQLSLRRQR
ncbi:leukemia NUP98 fusion partner 1 isoform X5 [Pygocentrus nattereri]|uniref:leukemia NUP98 fusion partner 1 isoform X5 n=1 Tax=Pygocentrus nattereri TaxID=42514 RepID=UPI0018912F52|nr:leukemia NUP98 fusion partner 1 isoform X5 [Pygocentrus nattereri]